MGPRQPREDAPASARADNGGGGAGDVDAVCGPAGPAWLWCVLCDGGAGGPGGGLWPGLWSGLQAGLMPEGPRPEAHTELLAASWPCCQSGPSAQHSPVRDGHGPDCPPLSLSPCPALVRRGGLIQQEPNACSACRRAQGDCSQQIHCLPGLRVCEILTPSPRLWPRRRCSQKSNWPKRGRSSNAESLV